MSEQKMMETMTEGQRQAELMLGKIKLQEKKEYLDERVDGLIEEYLENLTQYGEENSLVIIQGTLLNIIVELQEVMGLVTTMALTMEILGEAVGLIDDSLLMIDDVFKSGIASGKRLKIFQNKRNMNRYIRSWRRRIKYLQNIYRGSIKISQSLAKMLTGMSKNLLLPPKKKSKNADAIPAGVLGDKAKALVAKKAAQMSGDAAAAAPAAPSFTPPKGGSGDPGVGGLV
jgi:hypothetical protein